MCFHLLVFVIAETAHGGWEGARGTPNTALRTEGWGGADEEGMMVAGELSDSCMHGSLVRWCPQGESGYWLDHHSLFFLSLTHTPLESRREGGGRENQLAKQVSQSM